MQTLDAVLNRITMYRVVLYGLMGLLAIAEVLALTGALSISAGGLALSIVALGVSSYISNTLIAKFLHAATNSESWLISALILACILPPATTPARLGLMLLAGAVAMASKYVLVYRGSHVFNPVALAAFVMSITGLLPATWWVATPVLAPFTAILALGVLRKQRKFTVFAAFAGTAVLMLLFVSGLLHGQPVADVLKNAALSWPIVFLGSIMLTEPTTLPATRYYQVLFAVLVAAVFASQLHIGRVSATPQVALLVGNLFTLVFVPAFGAMLRLKHITQLAPDIYDAAFERPAHMFAFSAGQYLEWTLPHAHPDLRGNRRIFSIASAPTEPDIHIGFRHYEHSSTFKTALLAMSPGKYIRAAHVAGNFMLPADLSQPLLFIAGGIGITPLRSMVQQLVDTGQQADIVLLYFAARAEDFVYRDVFDSAVALGVRTQYIVGRPTAEAIAAATQDAAARTAYLSGPDALVTGTKALLRSIGVPAAHIHTDHFTGY